MRRETHSLYQFCTNQFTMGACSEPSHVCCSVFGGNFLMYKYFFAYRTSLTFCWRRRSEPLSHRQVAAHRSVACKPATAAKLQMELRFCLQRLLVAQFNQATAYISFANDQRRADWTGTALLKQRNRSNEPLSFSGLGRRCRSFGIARRRKEKRVRCWRNRYLMPAVCTEKTWGLEVEMQLKQTLRFYKDA